MMPATLGVGKDPEDCKRVSVTVSNDTKLKLRLAAFFVALRV